MAIIHTTDAKQSPRIHAWFSAVVANDLQLMDDLLAHGVPVDVPHPLRHTTALMEATRRGRTATVRWLLEHGATPALLCGMPQGTALHSALRLRHLDVAILLAEADTNIQQMDDMGRTPLHVLVSEITEGEDQTKLGKLAELLVAKKCPIDALDREGITALHYAVINDNAALIEVLLTMGANPNTSTPDTGMSPLAMAALDKNPNLAALLMYHGANPHQPIRDGATPATIFPAITRMVAGVPPSRPIHRLADIPTIIRNPRDIH